MPRKTVASNASLGKQLLKSKQISKNKQKRNTYVPDGEGPAGGFKKHTTDLPDENKPKLSSVLEQNSLEEFVQLAALSNKKFIASKEATVINANEVIPVGQDNLQNQVKQVNQFLDAVEGQEHLLSVQNTPLKIPRRPEWNKDMSAHEIATQENVAFLQWRRDIAMLEENSVNLAITPFEKNLEVWKQLWRVIEKSDLLLQIVDARNPFFYYSSDLEKYINEVSTKVEEENKNDTSGNKKEFLLLINKADYLSQELIDHWNAYFKEKNVKHFFFSALDEQEKLDHEALLEMQEQELAEMEEEEEEEDDEDEEEDEEEEEEKEKNNEDKPEAENEDQDKVKESEQKEQNQEQEQQEYQHSESEEEKNEVEKIKLEFNLPHIFTRNQLMALLKKKAKELNRNYDNRLMVGTVGYPNVGKSSVINVLCGRKRVGVASLPGKTKHFQTLNIENDICLCDCPGLVFPSFANSKAEMMCCGVLPIDSIREHISPVQLVMSRVPKEVLECQYKVILPPRTSRLYTASTFLQVYAASKGWLTGRGLPDEFKAAKIVLKDFTTGKLLYCEVRPDYQAVQHGAIAQSGFKLDMPTDIKEQPSATNYEEIKTNASATEESEQIDTTSMQTNGGATTQSILSGLQKTQEENKQQPQKKQLFQDVEQDLDQDFFTKEDKKKVKLNKGEKRALKFAVKNGADLSQFNEEEVKQYLVTSMKQQAINPNAREVKTGVAKGKKSTQQKISSYAQLDLDEN